MIQYLSSDKQLQGVPMAISRLAHYSIRTTDLHTSERFYTQALGFRVGYRPPFNFPGLWLYQGEDESGYGIVHIIGVDPKNREGLSDYLGDLPAESLHGSGSVDHVAFDATGWYSMREKFGSLGIAYRERTVPSLELHQVFIKDPSGVTVELNFPVDEPR
jgi:catechol 2,3-dioxygenase-like lactoylglutathione lyase family enzyme